VGADDSGGAWKLEAQRVLLVDGAVRFHADAPAGGVASDLSADSVLAEVKSAGGGLDFTCIVESLGLRGAKPVELGQLKFAGRAEGVTDLSQILAAKVNATAELGQLLRGEISIPSLKPLRATVRASGAAEVSKFAMLLPKGVSDRLTPSGCGRVEVAINASYGEAGLAVSELSVRAADLRLKV
jgi:hypothetical protein